LTLGVCGTTDTESDNIEQSQVIVDSIDTMRNTTAIGSVSADNGKGMHGTGDVDSVIANATVSKLAIGSGTTG